MVMIMKFYYSLIHIYFSAIFSTENFSSFRKLFLNLYFRFYIIAFKTKNDKTLSYFFISTSQIE